MEKRLKPAQYIVSLALILCLIDLVIGLSSMFVEWMLIPAIIISTFTLTVLSVGYYLYGNLCKTPHCSEKYSEQAKTLNIIFSRSNLILSLTDILINAFVLILAKYMTAGNPIALAVGINTIKSIKVAINGMSVKIRWQKWKIFCSMTKQIKLNRRSKMKRFLKWVFISNPKTWSSIVLILGSVGLALVGTLEGVDWGAWTSIVSPILGTVGAAIAAWAGLEYNVTADARKKVEENLAKAKEEANKLATDTLAKLKQEAFVKITNQSDKVTHY